MCIVAIAWQVLDEMPLCLISNRDEFYQRPASQTDRANKTARPRSATVVITRNDGGLIAG